MKRTQLEKRQHLFRPHTDQCVYCLKSAQVDAIENTPRGFDLPVPCGRHRRHQKAKVRLFARLVNYNYAVRFSSLSW
jgi:hypothetical protein